MNRINLLSNIKKSLSVGILALAFLPLLSFAQDGYFQGTFDYRISVTGKGSSDFLVNEPAQKMLMHVSAPNYIIHLYEARYPKSFLYIADSNQTYSLDAANKRAFRKTRFVDTTSTPPVARKTGKTAVVKGITCDEYVTKKPKMHTFFYVCDQYRVDTTVYDTLTEAKANFLVRGLGGRIPIRTIIKQPGLVITTTAVTMKRKNIDPANFVIPMGWKVKGRDNRF